ncbi:MAG: hypothetical protein QOH68_109 [Nocardioidaceae bacterium]|jgi:hypothetical protein|nr:hypothetical protein [Nocardioidaceae bacterium]
MTFTARPDHIYGDAIYLRPSALASPRGRTAYRAAVAESNWRRWRDAFRRILRQSRTGVVLCAP